MTYPRVESVTPLPGKRLRVTFSSGVRKVYDCAPLLKSEPFAPLENDAFFAHVRPADGGYGVVWSDEVDLSESELWLHGKEEGARTRRRVATAS
ncbi:MAG TPA: DUF2442 domain-containing protein [Planctomycetota bacterium]|nr:DUF2442 domain-containing protein [Planctomycetota bacterium]